MRFRVVAPIAAALVIGGAAVAAGAGPGTPLAETHGGYAVCLAPTGVAASRTTTAPDGTQCTATRQGVYFVQHGVTGPHTAQVTLQPPHRGFTAADLGPTTLRVTVGYPQDPKRLYARDLRFWWSVSA